MTYPIDTHELKSLLQGKNVSGMEDNELGFIAKAILFQIKCRILHYSNLQKKDTPDALEKDSDVSIKQAEYIVRTLQENKDVDVLTDAITSGNHSVFNESLLLDFSEHALQKRRFFNYKDKNTLFYIACMREILVLCHQQKSYHLNRTGITDIKSRLILFGYRQNNRYSLNSYQKGDAKYSMFSLLKTMYDHMGPPKIDMSTGYQRLVNYNVSEDELEQLTQACQQHLDTDELNTVSTNLKNNADYSKKLKYVVSLILNHQWHTDRSYRHHRHAELIIRLVLFSNMHSHFELWDKSTTKKLLWYFFSAQSNAKFKPTYVMHNHSFINKLKEHDLAYHTPNHILQNHKKTIMKYELCNPSLSCMLLDALSRTDFISIKIHGDWEDGLTDCRSEERNSKNQRFTIILSEKEQHNSTVVIHELAHVIQLSYLREVFYEPNEKSKKDQAHIANILKELVLFQKHKSNRIQFVMDHIVTLNDNSHYEKDQHPEEIHAELVSIEVNHPQIFKHIKAECIETSTWYNKINDKAYRKAFRAVSPEKRYLWPR
jgi:hypothetical protein